MVNTVKNKKEMWFSSSESCSSLILILWSQQSGFNGFLGDSKASNVNKYCVTPRDHWLLTFWKPEIYDLFFSPMFRSVLFTACSTDSQAFYFPGSTCWSSQKLTSWLKATTHLLDWFKLCLVPFFRFEFKTNSFSLCFLSWNIYWSQPVLHTHTHNHPHAHTHTLNFQWMPPLWCLRTWQCNSAKPAGLL